MSRGRRTVVPGLRARLRQATCVNARENEWKEEGEAEDEDHSRKRPSGGKIDVSRKCLDIFEMCSQPHSNEFEDGSNGRRSVEKIGRARRLRLTTLMTAIVCAAT